MPTVSPASVLEMPEDLSIYNAVEIQQRLVEAVAATSDTLILDLAKVAEFDTSGVQLLLATQAALATQGRALRLINSHQAVIELLDFFNLSALHQVES